MAFINKYLIFPFLYGAINVIKYNTGGHGIFLKQPKCRAASILFTISENKETKHLACYLQIRLISKEKHVHGITCTSLHLKAYKFVN